MKVPLFKPNLGAQEIKNLKEVFESGWVGLGPKTNAFENKIANYIGTNHAIGVTSCTAALHLALQALDVKSGDEVIVPGITVVSTAYAALYNGATPIFADVEEDSLCLNPEDFELKITPKTKVVIPVHLGGHSCDMDKIIQIAEKYKISVVEDCANALGAEYNGKKVGSIGHIGCFSFESKKNITTGDGGMIVTNNNKLAEKIKALRWYGSYSDTWKRFAGNTNYSWHYDVSEMGWKYNMNDIMAAIGLAQFEKLPYMNVKKDKLREDYSKALKNISWLDCPKDKNYTKSGWWLYVVRIKNGLRDKFITYLDEEGITASVHFPPVYHHSYFVKQGFRANLHIAEKVSKEIVSLPLFSSMSNDEFDYVVDKIIGFPN